MSLYPSLEDLKFDQLASAQYANSNLQPANGNGNTAYPAVDMSYNSRCSSDSSNSIYPSFANQPSDVDSYPYHDTKPQPPPYSAGSAPLYPSLSDYMGLDISPEALSRNMPENAFNAVMIPPPNALANVTTKDNMVAPITSNSVAFQRSRVNHGIREVVLCKNAKGKIGIRVCAVNKGIFVCLVDKNTPAAIAGVKFGDQILQINGKNVAGFTMEEVHSIFKKTSDSGISVVFRDRPFERTVALHKDSAGHLGFQFKNGEIIGLAVDSSAARNGLLTDHHLLEIDGQNVVGMKDKEISAIIEKASNIVTVTIIPSLIYNHIVKKMAPSLFKSMDHSVANF